MWVPTLVAAFESTGKQEIQRQDAPTKNGEDTDDVNDAGGINFNVS